MSDHRHCVCGHHSEDHNPASLKCDTTGWCDCKKWTPCHGESLEREREADRAAIRWLIEWIKASNYGSLPGTVNEHAAAISRATGQEGAR